MTKADDQPWKCAGCGAETTDRIRNCDCPTGCLYRPGSNEAAVKIEPPEQPQWLIPLAVWLAAERIRVDAANTMRHDTTSDLTPRLMCRVGVSDIGLVLAWLDQHRTTEAKDA
ncbi:hypothetical protein [Synechococcus phage Ssp-JY42]|nr:hypothetical protein [Synechococcus phage Yong-M4-211]